MKICIKNVVVKYVIFFQLVMGSSKLASLREPLLQLDLMVESKNSKRILDMELNKDELDTFINTMESIVQ